MVWVALTDHFLNRVGNQKKLTLFRILGYLNSKDRSPGHDWKQREKELDNDAGNDSDDGDDYGNDDGDDHGNDGDAGNDGDDHSDGGNDYGDDHDDKSQNLFYGRHCFKCHTHIRFILYMFSMRYF